MIKRSLIFGLLAAATPFFASAGSLLQFPGGAVQGFESRSPSSTMQLAIGPFTEGAVETMPAKGDIHRQVWKTANSDMQTIDLLDPLRAQLETAGYRILFECETRACGGFDFRFNTDVVDEPDMHVDLGDYRYLSAVKQVEEESEFVGLLVSKSPESGFVQVTTIGPATAKSESPVFSTKQVSAEVDLETEDTLEARLSTKGVFVLEGLEFSKGSSNLDGNSSDDLQDLARLLADDPGKKVVLVGHTDASGSLKGNIALSRKRAGSVMTRLIETYGVNPGQLSAEGVGFLAPRASNQSEEGREKNRRVEVVLTPNK